MSGDEASITYAVRLHRQAIQDIEEVQQRLTIFSGEARAEEWRDGLLTALSTLATYPNRFPLAREDRVFQRSVRQLLYPQPPSSASLYRVLFTIYETGEEAPFVFILHIRHSSRKPITRREAQEIQSD